MLPQCYHGVDYNNLCGTPEHELIYASYGYCYGLDSLRDQAGYMGVRCYHGDTDVVPLSFAVFTFSLCSGGGWMVKPLKWFVFSLTP